MPQRSRNGFMWRNKNFILNSQRHKGCIKKKWQAEACLRVWSSASCRKCLRYSGSMLITNSSRIHRMEMFASAQLHRSGAPLRLHPASSQQRGEERNPPLLQLSSKSKPTLQLYSGAHGSICYPDLTCGQHSHREMMAFKACHIISYHCHHFCKGGVCTWCW